MGKNRFVDPDVVRIDIGDGDWIEVKKELTFGEHSDSQAALIKEVRADGRVTPDFAMISKAEVLAYLVDWSFMRGDKKIKIETDQQKLAAINGLRPADMDIVKAAVTKHIGEMAEAATKNLNGGSASSTTSPSAGG